MRFFKTLLAVILGFFISIGIMMFVLIIMVSALSSAVGKETAGIKVEDNSVLVIDFSEPVNDYSDKTEFEDLDMTFEDYNSMNHLLSALEKAQNDNRIKGISIKTSGMVSGIARIKELRSALESFKSSGKFVYAFNDVITQGDYYLQSVSDSIFLSPLGTIDLKGLSSEVLFFKDFQEQTGVKMEVIRHGKYKSAVEPFIANQMSEANREQITELLTSLWSSIADEIAKSRNISLEKLNAIADNLEARNANLALKNHIIDGVIYQNQFDSLLVKSTQSSKYDDIHFINIEDYAEAENKKAVLKKPKDKIAVLYAEGEIIYGNGRDGSFGQENISEALQQIREDEDVKAIVLRVNSPGGSALASELIHHELELTKEKLPVYVSMGNYAASGGYYISCNADKIFADASTITGSIGVFGVLPNFKELADKWGINAEQVSTHRNSAGYSIFEKPSEEFVKITTESVEDIYNIFVKRVAQGRNMTEEQVNEIAQGRVWSGKDAVKNGLVDDLKTLEETIQYAAEQNEMQEYSIAEYPVRKTSFEAILKRLGLASVKENLIKEELGAETVEIIRKMRILSQQKGVQARMPFEIIVK